MGGSIFRVNILMAFMIYQADGWEAVKFRV